MLCMQTNAGSILALNCIIHYFDSLLNYAQLRQLKSATEKSLQVGEAQVKPVVLYIDNVTRELVRPCAVLTIRATTYLVGFAIISAVVNFCRHVVKAHQLVRQVRYGVSVVSRAPMGINHACIVMCKVQVTSPWLSERVHSRWRLSDCNCIIQSKQRCDGTTCGTHRSAQVSSINPFSSTQGQLLLVCQAATVKHISYISMNRW